MELNAIKVGNFVNKQDVDGKNNIFEILTGADIDLIVNEKTGAYTPIDLTEAWLLKLDFVPDVDITSDIYYQFDRYFYHLEHQILYYKDEDKEDFIPDGKDRILVPMGTKVSYVHQLQNLLYSMISKEHASDIIDIQELRIGNFVDKAPAAGSLEVYEIQSGTDIDEAAKNGTDGHLPVELTESWLEKFGFELRWDDYYGLEDYYYNTNDKTLYFSDVWQDKILVTTGAKIMYVHQLQNRWYSLLNRELGTEKL